MGEQLEIPITIHFHNCERRFHAFCAVNYPADGETKVAYMDEWGASSELAAAGLRTTLEWFLRKHALAAGPVALQSREP